MDNNLRKTVMRRIIETPDEELKKLLFILDQEENEHIFFMHLCQTIIAP